MLFKNSSYIFIPLSAISHFESLFPFPAPHPRIHHCQGLGNFPSFLFNLQLHRVAFYLAWPFHCTQPSSTATQNVFKGSYICLKFSLLTLAGLDQLCRSTLPHPTLTSSNILQEIGPLWTLSTCLLFLIPQLVASEGYDSHRNASFRIPTLGNIIHWQPQLCILKFITTYVSEGHILWATPKQSLNTSKKLREVHS